jgi:hypothetical protein
MWAPVLAAALTLVNTHTWIERGPALGGARVTWATTTAVYTSRPVRRVWHAGRVSVPSSIQEDPQFSYSVSQGITLLTSTAFIRTVELHRRPRCDCPGGPLRGQPIRGELWVRRAERFRRVSNRAIVVDADVDGRSVVYAEHGALNRVVLLGRGVLASSPFVTYSRVRIAGSYAGWLEQNDAAATLYAGRTLVVYDLARQRVAYRLGPAPIASFDLAADGTVAFGEDPTPVGGPDGGIGWASLAHPTPHYLPGDALPFAVRLAGNRAAFFTRDASGNSLVLESLDGKRKRTFDAVYGDFDLDSRRIAYLQSPKVIAIARIP